MNTEKLYNIFNQFKHDSQFIEFKELVSGHINDTYLVITKSNPNFVLQRINHKVFKDVKGLIDNKVAISEHIQNKLKQLPKEELERRVLRFVKTNNNDSYFQDEARNYWNLMYFIDDSVTFETVTNVELAYESGKLFGEFLNLTSDFEVAKLTEVIPKFHDMSFRFSQFLLALKSASKERLFHANDAINFVFELKEEMHILQSLKESGQLKLRVTHNDTKISNALFTKNHKGLCVIDTDTIMPGIIHYDFGDAIRTICNTAEEDEENLNLVEFNTQYYKAYKKGFLEKVATSLSALEIEYLPLAAKTMIFIMGLRFLTDYLNDDVYYKIKYPTHNLVRAKNQFKLVQSLSERFNEIANK